MNQYKVIYKDKAYENIQVDCKREPVIVGHHCHECGFSGEVLEKEKKLTCPKCGTTNDVWLSWETPPENHRPEEVI